LNLINEVVSKLGHFRNENGTIVTIQIRYLDNNTNNQI